MKLMKNRALAMLLVLALCLSMIPAVAQAASYTYNTGTRHDYNTTLSSQAEAYYTGEYTWDKLSNLTGGNANCLETDNPLFEALHELMSDTMTNSVSYKSLPTYWEKTDASGGSAGMIWFYADHTGSGTMSREHVWPKSHASFHEKNGGADLHHLRPSISNVNSTRGNMIMGNVRHLSGYTTKNYIYYTNNICEVEDNIKGDVARILLYVWCRWEEPNLFKDTPNPVIGPNDEKNDGGKVIESLETLLEWCKLDPVDTWEMSRNDQVQNIQGNRNVFIDYPELAFLVFGRDVPADMTTPSGGEGTAVSYTVTAQSSNTAYGTVSVSGNTVTATPKTGYVVSGYTIVNGTGTVTRNGNVFTVTPTSNVTIRINFTPKTQVTLKYIENGVLTATKTAYAGDTVTLAANTVTPDGDRKFVGWTDTVTVDATTQPTVYAAGSSYTVSANTTLYALYTYSVGGTGEMAYQLVESTDQLSVGASVIIAAKDYGYAISTNQKDNNRGAAAVTKDAANKTATLSSDVAVLTLGAGTKSGTYTFYDEANNGYLYAASSGSNHLKTKSDVDANASFAITVSGGTATVKAQGSYSRNTMQFNNNSSTNLLFSCYSSASQRAICLYVLTGTGGTKYYTTTIGCSHEYVDGLCCKCELIGDGEQNYASFADAISETGGDCLWLNFDLVEDIEVDCDIVLDLNGKTLTGDVEIYSGASLKLIDSATDDYTADNRGRIIGSINGELIRTANSPAEYGCNYKYLTIQEKDGSYSAHRVYLSVKSVALAPCITEGVNKASAISYKTVFKCSDFVAEYVTDYGIQVTGEDAVSSSYGIDVVAGENWGSLRLASTLSTANSSEVNAANAKRKVSVSAYIALEGNSGMVSAPVTRSLQDLVLYANRAENLTDIQKKVLGSMYTAFAGVMESWNIENIKSYVN